MPTSKKTVTVTAQKKVVKKSAKDSLSTKVAVPKERSASSRKQTRVSACSCVTRCTPEEAFWINNGPVVSSVAELRDAIAKISVEQYQYHTTREGNDFARWLRDCLGDAARAKSLESAKTKAAAVRALSGTCCK